VAERSIPIESGLRMSPEARKTPAHNILRSALSRYFGMNERQWELYRLSVVETWPDSPLKAATVAGIHHKLAAIDHAEASIDRASSVWKPVKKAA
jgi:hypothetical protein